MEMTQAKPLSKPVFTHFLFSARSANLIRVYINLFIYLFSKKLKKIPTNDRLVFGVTRKWPKVNSRDEKSGERRNQIPLILEHETFINLFFIFFSCMCRLAASDKSSRKKNSLIPLLNN